MRNRSVARYIPLDKLREQLKDTLGDKCDVCEIIESYLSKKREKMKEQESDSFTQLNDVHDEFNKTFEENQKKYDIGDAEHLIFYKKGNTVVPGLLGAIKEGMEFFKTILEEPEFTELSQGDYKEKCKFLEEQNRSLMLMNSVWLRIFDDIKDDPDSFKRYYPVVRTELSHDSIRCFVRAYAENDDFYELCQSL